MFSINVIFSAKIKVLLEALEIFIFHLISITAFIYSMDVYQDQYQSVSLTLSHQIIQNFIKGTE